MSDSIAVGVDVGGTKVEGLLLALGPRPRVLERRKVETPADDAEATVATIVSVAADLMAGRDDVLAVGVGAAGMVELGGALRFAPNLSWREIPLADRVADGLPVPTLVDNDANTAAWGEHRFGAGKGWSDMLLVAVGTGIGGGIVSGGRLFRGAHGFAGEIGHIIVDPNGPPCGCGNLGCWEQVASGRALGRLGRGAAADHPESYITELAGGNPEHVTGEVVTDAGRQGDPMARRILEEVGRRLGEGIAGIVNALDPNVVVVGGGVIAAGDLLLEPARRAFRDAVEGPEHRPEIPIVAAALGTDAGAVGAADLAVMERART